MDVWDKRKYLWQGYVDDGSHICVIAQTCIEKMGLVVAGKFAFCIRMEKHQRFKGLGVVKSLEVEACVVSLVVDFHLMPIELGSDPIILGRPWLHVLSAVQD